MNQVLIYFAAEAWNQADEVLLSKYQVTKARRKLGSVSRPEIQNFQGTWINKSYVCTHCVDVRYASRLRSCESIRFLQTALPIQQKNYCRLSRDIRREHAAISLTLMCSGLYKHIRQAFHVSQPFVLSLSFVVVRNLACETDNTGELWTAMSSDAALGNTDASSYKCWISTYKILSCDTQCSACCEF